MEDNEDIGFMLTTILGRAGYDVSTAAGPTEALEVARREHFDLFILDTTFKEGSGLDLCRALRESHPDTPVVFYSAAAFDSDRQAALLAGACAYVTKPGTEELVEAVRRALDAG
ncbi:MAG: response regulator transcription factor [Pyrinomonadaceae bacterium]